MKTRKTLHHSAVLLALTAASLLPAAQAADRYWKAPGGTGTWNNNPASAVWDAARPSSSDTAWFAYDNVGSYPTSGTVTVNQASGFTTGSPQSLNVRKGTWTLNLNLTTNMFAGSSVPGVLTLGDGAGNTPTVALAGTAAGSVAKLGFTSIVLGANGSAGNKIGTATGSTVTFSNVSFERGGSATALAWTLGTLGGGGDNVFRAAMGGQLASLSVASATINAAASGQPANRLELDGVTLTSGQVALNGNATSQNDITAQAWLHNGAVVSGSGVSVGGSGSEFRVDGGAKWSGTASAIVSGSGRIVVDGANSELNFTGENIGLGTNGGGTITISHGAKTSGGALFTVSAAGSLTIDAATASFAPALGAAAPTAISGLLDVKNGSTVTVATDGGSKTSVVMNDGSTMRISGGSTVAIDGAFFHSAGSAIQITGGSMLTLTKWEGSNGELAVEAGSTFHIDKLNVRGTTGSKTTTVAMSVQGYMTWGDGSNGVTGIGFGRGGGAIVPIGSGALVELLGGNYNLSVTGQDTNPGYLRVNGGTLIGSGVIGSNDDANGTHLQLLAGEINPGTDDAPGNINARQGFDVSPGTTCTFTVFGPDDGAYDTLSAPIEQSVDVATLKVELTSPGLLAQGERLYPFRQSASGEPHTATAQSFDLPDLSADGLAWDTTHFIIDGSLRVVAEGTTPLNQWREQWFGTEDNSGAAANTAISANDGLTNLYKFATTDGTVDPRLPAKPSEELNYNGSSYVFRYTRNKAAATLVTYAVKWSDTLQPGSWSSTGVDAPTVTDFGAYEQVDVGVPLGGSTRRFVRLEVTSNNNN